VKQKIAISDFIVLSDLADRINVDPVELIEKGIELGLMVTINQRIDLKPHLYYLWSLDTMLKNSTRNRRENKKGRG